VSPIMTISQVMMITHTSLIFTGRSGKDDKYEDFAIGTSYGSIGYNRIERT